MAAKRAPGTGTMRRRRDRRVVWGLLAGLVGLVLLGGWFLRPYWKLSGTLAAAERVLPSRLYGRALRLETGMAIAPDEVAARLQACGYRPGRADGIFPGTFFAGEKQVAVAQRRFLTPRGPAGGSLLTIDFDGERIAALRVGRETVTAAYLEPQLLASFYGPELLDVVPVRVAELPREVVLSVLAAEDAGFFEHPGLSPTGIARALWTNLRGGGVRQGGSTLTQQLVKNRFLTHERTVERKLREAVLALMVELRYEKSEILAAYLDEAFWGKPGSVNLIGIGAAARGYFAKEAAELSLPEAALLAGMIRSPAELSPYRHPEAALARRNLILDRLAELRWVAGERIIEAKAAPLGVVTTGYGKNRVPWFGDFAAAEAKRRLGLTELADAGLVVLSTLDPRDQEAAERAVAEGLDALDESGRRAALGGEAALVSIDPRGGGVRAWVGGRDFKKSQFDRVAQARRQAGSAFKPVVYAAAFAAGVANPATMLEDAPLTVTLANQVWTPSNDDDEFRGWVSAREAVAASLNVPTVRLAMGLGLPPIVALARRMGVESRLQPLPSLALGSFELSPLELATVYATLAGEGVRPPVHVVDAAFDRQGAALPITALPPPQRVLDAPTAYLVTSLLEGVVEHGTARRARELGLTDPVAGKTGTSNAKRDAWFAGYAPNRVALVWVGHDDDTTIGFGGSRAALPIWVGFMKRVRPPGGFGRFAMPDGLVRAVIDPASGELATERCPERVEELFRAASPPTVYCHFHGGAPSELGADDPRQGESRNAFLRWLDRVFKRKRERPPG